ncbi:MAG: acyltransferase [Hyphomicrobiales bacterium]|nr:acyltransferase [Hyphomicrobiales bacterium]
MNELRNGAIDELRGMAFLAVLVSHIGLVYGLDLRLAYAMAIPAFGVGVDLFFVISGFVIARNLADMRDRAAGDGLSSAAAFWLRRVVRITPPVWATAATIAAVRLAFAPVGYSADLVAGAGFYANFYWAACMAGQEGVCPSPLITSHFWSLALEMQFYALAPALAALPRALAGIGLAGVLIVGATLERPVGGLLWSLRPDGLLLGMVLADQAARRAAWLRALPRIGLMQAAYWMFVAAMTARLATGPISGLGLTVVASICAYVVAARLTTGASAGPLAGWLRKGGEASYAAYLVHLPVLSGVHAALAGAPPALSLMAALAGVALATVALDAAFVKPAASLGRRWSDAIIKNCKMRRGAYN